MVEDRFLILCQDYGAGNRAYFVAYQTVAFRPSYTEGVIERGVADLQLTTFYIPQGACRTIIDASQVTFAATNHRFT